MQNHLKITSTNQLSPNRTTNRTIRLPSRDRRPHWKNLSPRGGSLPRTDSVGASRHDSGLRADQGSTAWLARLDFHTAVLTAVEEVVPELSQYTRFVLDRVSQDWFQLADGTRFDLFAAEGTE